MYKLGPPSSTNSDTFYLTFDQNIKKLHQNFVTCINIYSTKTIIDHEKLGWSLKRPFFCCFEEKRKLMLSWPRISLAEEQPGCLGVLRPGRW